MGTFLPISASMCLFVFVPACLLHEWNHKAGGRVVVVAGALVAVYSRHIPVGVPVFSCRIRPDVPGALQMSAADESSRNRNTAPW